MTTQDQPEAIIYTHADIPGRTTDVIFHDGSKTGGTQFAAIYPGGGRDYIAVYSAERARELAAAFTRAAELLDPHPVVIAPECSRGDCHSCRDDPGHPCEHPCHGEPDVAALIEAGSLGTPGARKLRARAGAETVAAIRDRAPQPACAKCHAEPRAPGGPYGAKCLDMCYEALEFDHCCMICATPEEARALGFPVIPAAQIEAEVAADVRTLVGRKTAKEAAK